MTDSTGRYPGGDPTDPIEVMRREMVELRRRVAGLEGAPLVGSQITGKDTDANTRAIVGDLGDSHYGFATYDADGVEMFRTDERGIISPSLSLAMQPFANLNAATSAIPITSSSFGACWLATVPDVLHQGVFGRIAIGTPASTTAEVRVRALPNIGNPAGVRSTDAKAVPASTSAILSLRWLHGLVLPGQIVQFIVEVRRASGAGTVNSIWPEVVALTGGQNIDGDYSASGWL